MAECNVTQVKVVDQSDFNELDARIVLFVLKIS